MTEQGLLFPRLDSTPARLLIAERVGCGLEELETLAETSHPLAAPSPTGGHPAGDVKLQQVQTAIRLAAKQAGYPKALPRGGEQTFDRPCGTALFRTMGIVTADAADPGVWSFLSLVLVPEIGPWRFPGRTEERLLGTPRNVLRRLWWRAWTFGDDLDAAPAGCQPLGEDEFVQIMERPSLGGNRRTARALRNAIWRAEASGSTASRSELMRELTRRFRAVRSHIAVDVLSEPQLSQLLAGLVVDSHRRLTSSGLQLL